MPDDRFIHRRAGHSQKVNLLTDLEHRVWIQYILSADDFGVMRGTHHPIQNDNDHLKARPAKRVQRCLDAIAARGLIRTFTHQGQPYVFQHDWQNWQKVQYPRSTNLPAPPAELIAECSSETQKLFLIHPGGAGRTRKERSGNVPEIVPEDSPLMRAGPPAKRLTAKANGERLTADGPEPLDLWARELVNLYPPQGRCGWNLVERPLYAVLTADNDVSCTDAWNALKVRLESQKRSHQWRVKLMIPRLDSWLSKGLHLQELPESAPETERLSNEPSWVQAAKARKAAAGQA